MSDGCAFLEGMSDVHTGIRIVAGMVLEILRKDSPNLFGDYTLVELPDGTRGAQTEFRKV
ncbi:MAG: hypothetical protein KJ057_06735 [Phycisphaerae bacterium]|nr:MAG: hypothetical protein F9K17_08495 [Phycisphaerae bacterium]MBE7456678.1 hypothetical protein [Planctomycetia bacterium]MCK6463943.1 hypothetical protein [Phycisphaerae bacterium]MCL4718157.1 hypothetical protein [Phycisphaerae bacterium]